MRLAGPHAGQDHRRLRRIGGRRHPGIEAEVLRLHHAVPVESRGDALHALAGGGEERRDTRNSDQRTHRDRVEQRQPRRGVPAFSAARRATPARHERARAPATPDPDRRPQAHPRSRSRAGARARCRGRGAAGRRRAREATKQQRHGRDRNEDDRRRTARWRARAAAATATSQPMRPRERARPRPRGMRAPARASPRKSSTRPAAMRGQGACRRHARGGPSSNRPASFNLLLRQH